jgi:seryl-tRNA synthetase
MLDIKYIRENVDQVKENVRNRRAKVDVDALLRLDEERLQVLKKVEELRKERNEVAEKMKATTADARPVLIERGKVLKEEISAAEKALEAVEGEWKGLLLQVPNMTHPEAPLGEDDNENKEREVFGEIKKLENPKDHVQLAAMHDLIDFERGAKVAGAKFYFLKGKMALLEQAIIQWAIKELVAEGYQLMITPDLARNEVLMGTGFNPRGDEQQIYSVENTDLSLIATAEIPLGGFHMDEIIDEEKLPLKYIGLSHCFRMEGGAYGRESYGLYRVHQFTKVEMFVFAAPGQSEAIHEELRRIEEMLFTKLGIPFRVVDICTGDLGGPAYRKYDLEAWMWGKGNGKGGWGEVTSASNCTDYQARRLNIKMRKKDGSLEYVHTLNGTAVALSRAPIAILENCQQPDGSILIPEVLRPYCGFDKIG